MKFQWKWVLGMTAILASSQAAWAQYANQAAPSLLPLPQVNPQWAASNYPMTQTPHAYSAQPSAADYQQPQARQAAYQPVHGGYAQLQPPAPPEAVRTQQAETQSAPQDQSPSDYGYPQHHNPLAVDPYNEAMCGEDWGGACELPTCCPPRWFGGVYGLLMTRDEANALCFSYDSNDLNYQPLTNRTVDWDWQGGIEGRIGHMVGCAWGLEAVYWGMFEDNNVGQVYAGDVTGQLETSLALNDLNFGVNNVTGLTSGAKSYRLQRNYEVQNLELNLLRFGTLAGACGQTCGPYGFGCNGCGSGLCLSGAAGVRYLRFDEGFSFESSRNGDWYDKDETMAYDVDAVNSLIGFQLGGRADYCCKSGFSLFSDIKFGMFLNYIEQSQSVVDGHGDYATINNGPNQGNEWNIGSHKDDISFLGEVRLGGAYQFSPCWRATAAYRAVALSGVALSTDQVPTNFGDYYGAEMIDSNGSLLLHGLQLGVECAF